MVNFHKLEESQIDIILEMMVDFYAIDAYVIDPAVSRENFEVLVSNPSYGQAFLIEEEGEFMGYMILAYVFSFEFKGRVVILDELYLSEAARGKGLGKKAVEYAQSYAQEQDCKKIFLEVETHNLRAQRLYEKLGFDFHPRKIMSYSIQKRK